MEETTEETAQQFEGARGYDKVPPGCNFIVFTSGYCLPLIPALAGDFYEQGGRTVFNPLGSTEPFPVYVKPESAATAPAPKLTKLRLEVGREYEIVMPVTKLTKLQNRNGLIVRLTLVEITVYEHHPIGAVVSYQDHENLNYHPQDIGIYFEPGGWFVMQPVKEPCDCPDCALDAYNAEMEARNDPAAHFDREPDAR